MRTLMAGVAAVVLLVGVAVSPASAGDTEPRPFRATVTGEFHVDGTCDGGAPWQVIEGTGIGSHLGRFTSEGGTCLTDPPTPPSVTWTMPNGDEIDIVFVIVPTGPPGVDGAIPFVIATLDVDGTGRFEGVTIDGVPTGTLRFEDPLVPVAGQIEFTVEGTITYDASNRAG